MNEPPALTALRKRRFAIAADFAAQIAPGVARRDTDDAVFHGCYDWHSAVHGVWALIAYQRATDDTRYAPIVARVLKRRAVAAERKLLAAKPKFEMPYGRAWLLRLAIEHRCQAGSDLLDAIADEAARSLVAHYREAPPKADTVEYANASWALINLFDHARARRDRALGAEVTRLVHARFLDAKPPSARREAGTFMGLAANHGALVARVLPPSTFRQWSARFFAGALPLPVTRPRTIHHHGLNFSRAWGYYDVWRATGEARFAEAYAAHLSAGVAARASWTGDYDSVGHWVAQFGLFALQPLFGARHGR